MGSSSTIWRPLDGVIETEIRGDISLYDAHREQVVVLNATASDVWRLCDGEMSVDEIVELLARAYQTSPDAIRADVQRTVDELIEAGFLVS